METNSYFMAQHASYMLCVVLCIQEKVCKVYFESHLCTDVMYSEWVNVLVHFLLHDILMLFAVAFTLNKYGPYNLKSRCISCD